jgi:transposase
VVFHALNQLKLKTSCAWRSRLESIQKVVRMLRRHETGLLNYSRHRISNACADGLNSAIQLIKASACEFRNFTNYRARILFHCGKLDMRLG